MNDPVDFCKYIADIEKNPSAHPPRLTVRQLLQAREHVQDCDNCNVRVERVLASAPKQNFPQRGLN